MLQSITRRPGLVASSENSEGYAGVELMRPLASRSKLGLFVRSRARGGQGTLAYAEDE